MNLKNNIKNKIKIIIFFMVIAILVLPYSLKTNALTISLTDNESETDIKASEEELQKGLDYYEKEMTLDDIKDIHVRTGDDYYLLWGYNDQTIIYLNLADEMHKIVINALLNDIDYNEDSLWGLVNNNYNNELYWCQWDLDGQLLKQEGTLTSSVISHDNLYYFNDNYDSLYKSNNNKTYSYTLKNMLIEETIAIISQGETTYLAFYGLYNDIRGSYVLILDSNFNKQECIFLTLECIQDIIINEDIIYLLNDGIHIRLSNEKEKIIALENIKTIYNVKGNIIGLGADYTYLINRVYDEYLSLKDMLILDYQEGWYSIYKDNNIEKYLHVSVAYHTFSLNNITYGYNQMYVGLNELSAIKIPSNQTLYGTYENDEALKIYDISFLGSNNITIPLKTNISDGHTYDLNMCVNFNADATLNGEHIESGFVLKECGSYTFVLKGHNDVLTTLTINVIEPKYQAKECSRTLSDLLKLKEETEEVTDETDLMHNIEENDIILYEEHDYFYIIISLAASLTVGILIGYGLIIFKRKRGVVC